MRSGFDRRQAVRYHVILPLKYSAVLDDSKVRKGTGVTTDLSRAAVRFTCDAPLPAGAPIKLSIQWPSPEDAQPLVLQTLGYILRSHSREVVALISRHELGPATKLGEP